MFKFCFGFIDLNRLFLLTNINTIIFFLDFTKMFHRHDFLNDLLKCANCKQLFDEYQEPKEFNKKKEVTKNDSFLN